MPNKPKEYRTILLDDDIHKRLKRASDEHRYSMRFITQVLLDAFLSLPNDKQDTILSSNRRQGNAKYE